MANRALRRLHQPDIHRVEMRQPVHRGGVHKVWEEGVELWAGLKEDKERVPGGTPQYVEYRYTVKQIYSALQWRILIKNIHWALEFTSPADPRVLFAPSFESEELSIREALDAHPVLGAAI
jgi:hypothetical protein